jgi:hypothetical protein
MANGALAQLSRPAGASIATCGDLWLSESAPSRLFTRCGTAFTVSNQSTDLSAAGALARAQNVSLQLRHLSDSTAAGEISAIASADDVFYYPPMDDRTLRRWAASTLLARDSVPFPTETVGTTVSRWQGRFVFYRSDGTERYVLVQLVDQMSGTASDYGFVTF